MSQPDQLPADYKEGLEGVIAGITAIGEIDAERDALAYQGYAAHELAEHSTFEEVAFLLLYGHLPNATELDTFRKDLAQERSLSVYMVDLLRKLPPRVHPMAAMRLAVSVMYVEDPEPDSVDKHANLRKAITLIAKAPVITAAIMRLHQGKDLVPPDPTLDHSTNFLYMAFGQKPDPEVARIFDVTNILYAEHGFNASTFSARVTASTLSDMHSAIASAIGTLKGPLHGGANTAAIQMLLKIGSAAKAEAWVRKALAKKEKIMGFGHRVYKKMDSRAPFMKKMADQMAKKVGDKVIFPLSCAVEELMIREKKLFANVDYHCAVAFYLMGLPPESYTAIFAHSRMAGWTAHVVEQHANNRLIRPDCFYNGKRGLAYVPLADRG